MSISHCIDNYVPGILNYAEMYDVAGLIAPRPLVVESGDPISDCKTGQFVEGHGAFHIQH